MKRIFALMLVLVFMIGIMNITPVLASGEIVVPDATVINPVEDTWTNQLKSTTNYGDSKYSVIRIGDRYFFMKFPISSIRENLSQYIEIDKAILTLYATGNDGLATAAATGSDVKSQIFYVENDTWNETQMTHDTKPDLGSAISDKVTIPAGTYYNNGNGSFTFNYDITDGLKKEVSDSSDFYLSCALNGANSDYVNQNVGFFTKDTTAVAYKPALTITYKVKDFDPDNAVVTASADTYVSNVGTQTTENYGGIRNIAYKTGSRLMYLKFDITNIRSILSEYTTIRTAKIRLYPMGVADYPSLTATETEVGMRAYSVADDNWMENSITWENKPEKVKGISGSVTIPAGTVYNDTNPPYFELDITDALLEEKDNTFSCIIDDDTYVNYTIYFFSKENRLDDASLAPTLIVDYALPEDVATEITSTELTIDGEYVHGYSKSETISDLLSKIVVPTGAKVEVFDGNVAVSDSATLKQGMKLRITSKDETKTKDYTIGNGELFVGKPEYLLSGVQSDGTYNNTSIDITIPVINYTDETKKLSIIIARYNGGSLEKASVYDKDVTARFDDDITQTYTEEGTRGKDVSYKVFALEKSSLAPQAASQLYSSAAAGKNIVVFGDSISAPVNDGYVKLLADASGANVTNAAVGGSRLIAGNDGHVLDNYDISLQVIVDKLYNKATDWSKQESYLTQGGDTGAAALNVNNFKNIDIADTDVVIIWIGTNDYNSAVSLERFEDEATAVIEKLTELNPAIKIVLASPMYRSRMSNGDEKNCYEYPNKNGDYLYEYGDIFRNLSNTYSNVTFLDLYNESGITKFSQEKYNYLSDGLHPYRNLSRANKILHALFAQKLAQIFN